uniref:non-specific serine/threonine protein kinase n=1 Tax=Hordeum vulgare subsp. vulgare TaxID=112509 RepID=A0A8I6YHL5_HORVV
MASMRPRRLGKPTTLIFPTLLLLSLGAIKISSAPLPDNSTDVLWLEAFKHEIISDPSGWLSSWNSSSSHCLWPGVKCSPTHPGRVVALQLFGLNLAGQISSSIGNLTFLTTLNLSTNGFSGQLPPLDHLQKLQVLDLSMNQLHGSIPYAISNCSNLRKVDLAKNFLIGEIPPKVGLLPNLSVLRLSFNNLTGAIPPILANITSMEKLILSYNSLTGSIPHEFGKLTNMSRLSLGGNRLSGGFPQCLFNISKSLQILGLESNMLSNKLPSNIGDDLPNLQVLYLNHNMFEGQIPASLGNALGLERLELGTNYLTGEITSSLGKLSNLYYLNLQQNNLEAVDKQSWEFFNGLTNCTSLEVLSLAGNQLQGTIPNTIGNFSSSLTEIYLGGNKLSGMVRTSVGNLGSLYFLGLEYNNLTGTIEEWTGKLTKLQGLNLQVNSFIGSLPSSLGQLTQLTELNLGNNIFEGPIPPTLGNLQQLSLLNLNQNNLQANIPTQIGSLTTLVSLDLSSNKLTGKIPDTLSKCQNIQTMQMAQNLLVGTIPISFRMLQSLSMLNLSHNSLSGAIPVSLNELQLSELDLSYNHLEGEIPRNGVFENAASTYLGGNWGLCGGVASLHMPLCHAVSRRSEIEYYLIRALIPLFGFMSITMLAYITIFGKKRSQRRKLLFLSFGKKFPRVSYNDLSRATGNFSEANLIGRGSYGSVYRGKLTQSKIQVAIKVFDLSLKCADRSFVTECDVLRSIRHRSLLPILTACSTIDNNSEAFKALIYEFMPKGNLDTWLHHKISDRSPKCLSLAQRATVVVCVADALAYLHYDCERQIVHCDVKPTNILLDDDMNAYLGDFGIASLVGHSSSNTSVGLKGTIGYIAPGMYTTPSVPKYKSFKRFH